MMNSARWLALFDSVVRDIRYAARSVRRTPLAALTILTTVGLGLGLVTVVFTILNVFVFRVDQVRDPNELFGVQRQQSADGKSVAFTREQYEALRRETSVFSDAFARTRDIDAWSEGRKLEGALVTGNFFHVLGVEAARGRTLTPADDDTGGRPVIVLSHRAWTSQFKADPEITSRTVLLNGTPFHVVGIMREGFRGLEVSAADFWAPHALIGEFRRGRAPGDDDGLENVGRLRAGLTRQQALSQLQIWDTQRSVERTGHRPSASLLLEPRRGTVPQPAEALILFTPLFFAFGLVLFIGCANVANLLLARGVARQREIGIRLAIGASRTRIVRQLLVENLLLALVAAFLGFLISRGALALVVFVVSNTFPPEFGSIRLAVPRADWRVALFLVAGAAVSTLLFALAPALHATRLELVRAIRGEVVRDARPGRARNVLLVLQVTGSALLLICSAVFLRSSWAAATVDPGIRTSDVAVVSVLDEQRRPAILDIIGNDPSVAVVAASQPAAASGRPGLASGAAGRTQVSYQLVSPRFFEVLDIRVVRGRSFTQNETSGSDAVAVVSESVAQQLWPGADALGQVLRLEPDLQREPTAKGDPAPPSRTAVVVGIARDVAGFGFGSEMGAGAGVYLPTDEHAAKTTLALRLKGDPERARNNFVDRFAAVDPNMAEIITLQTMARMAAYLLAIPFWLTLVLGALALILTLSGLFSVLSYLVEQRTQEIGVRMALGATASDVVRLVVSQSARPVGIGLLIGSGIAMALSAALLATPLADEIGSVIRLFDPIAYAASLACVLTACLCSAALPARRAGRIDPVRALRQD